MTIIRSASRVSQRKKHILALEEQQRLEDADDVVMTEEQRQTLLRCFESVKVEFVDLDGLSWTRSALRRRCHQESTGLPPIPRSPIITPPTPPASHTPAFAVLTNADLASFSPEDTIRASASSLSRTLSTHSRSTNTTSISFENTALFPSQGMLLPRPYQRRSGTRARSPVKGLFAEEPQVQGRDGRGSEAGVVVVGAEMITGEGGHAQMTDSEQVSPRGRSRRPVGSRSGSSISPVRTEGSPASEAPTILYAMGEDTDTLRVRSEDSVIPSFTTRRSSPCTHVLSSSLSASASELPPTRSNPDSEPPSTQSSYIFPVSQLPSSIKNATPATGSSHEDDNASSAHDPAAILLEQDTPGLVDCVMSTKQAKQGIPTEPGKEDVHELLQTASWSGNGVVAVKALHVEKSPGGRIPAFPCS